MKSKYFKREEFECSCDCGFAAVDSELLDILETTRSFFGNPITINSGCRCEYHNERIGGTPNSYHVKGMACDIVVKNIEPRVVQEYFHQKYKDQYGIGSYDTFTHIDVRPTVARWNG